MLKKGAKTIALALTFGVVASGAFQGSNYMINQWMEEEEQAEAVGGVKLQQAAGMSEGGITTANKGSGSLDISSIAEQAMPSVVSITNKSVQEIRMFGQSQAFENESRGTGIIIGRTDTELLLVTNNHVVNAAKEISVGFVDGEMAEAKVKGTDSSKDLAVLSIKMEDLTEETKKQIRVIELGKSSELQVGQQVVAIGNALGYGQSVTTGIVSALNREVTIEDYTNTLIQTDAAINPGNSGGGRAEDISEKVIERLTAACQRASSEKADEESRLKQSILDYVEENLSDSGFTLYDVALHFDYAESYLYRVFREQFGCTFSVMLETLRLERACQALERGDSIEATAQICGYNSSHTFRRAFKKRKGILPSDYRDSFEGKGRPLI